MPKLSEEEYLRELGQVCPMCKSLDIQSNGAIETDSDYGWQRIECRACDAEWSDVYKLVGYDLSNGVVYKEKVDA